MQFKQLHQLFLKLTHWLMMACVALAAYFAYLTYQHTHASIEQALTQETERVAQRAAKALALSQQELREITTQLDAQSEQPARIITSPYFTSVTARYEDGTQSMVYGAIGPNPSISEAIISHLATGKSAVLTLPATPSGVRMVMLQRLTMKQGVLYAEINQQHLLKMLGNPSTLQLQLIDGHLYLWKNPLLQTTQQLKPLIHNSTRYQQGFIELTSNNGDTNNVYNTLKTTQEYANPDWIVITSASKPPLLGMVVNTSSYSIAIFACFVALFSLYSLRSKLMMSIRRKNLEANTIQSQRKFISHLNSMSAMDTAILAGVKFDEITEISLRQMLSTIPSQQAGIVKLPSSNKAPAEIYLMSANHEKKVLQQKLDKWVLNALEHQQPHGHVLENIQDSAFFKGLLNDAPLHVLLLPIYKEGTVSSLLFTAFHPSHKLSEFELGCSRNISQHLGVALTAIAQSEKLFVKEYFDPVTGLFNQQACRERISQEMSRARRKKEKIAVFQLNLIGYKKINETFGYMMGDQLLKEVGARLKHNLRDTDILARMGSDDFVIITSDIDKITHANRLADKLTKLFSKPIAIYDHSFNVAAAIGISVFPQDGITVDEILNHANFAMNKAKKIGPNQYAFYEDNLSTNEAWRISLEKDLRHALINDQLFLKYQAQINPRSKKICGVEALIRWEHPERGLVSPMEFIGLSEETGLIVNIGQYARKIAFRQFVAWKQEGIDVGIMSVNVSSYEMQRQEFVAELLELMHETKITPQCIELEITESLMLELSGNVMQNLAALHEHGIKIAIDDFGTGYSNLSYLGRLPFDVLKIDKSFMHGIGLQSSSNQVVNMMIDMAHHLGKTVCAEGVENDIQYQFLENAGCDILQGYYLSKPLRTSEFPDFYHSKQTLRNTSHA